MYRILFCNPGHPLQEVGYQARQYRWSNLLCWNREVDVFIGDNTDPDLATKDGKTQHHGLRFIAISIERPGGTRIPTVTLPWNENVSWSQFEGNFGISMQINQLPCQTTIKLTVMSPNDPEIYTLRFMHMLSWISGSLNNRSSSWAGYMSELCGRPTLERSVVRVLLIISLPQTDLSALYFFLL